MILCWEILFPEMDFQRLVCLLHHLFLEWSPPQQTQNLFSLHYWTRRIQMWHLKCKSLHLTIFWEQDLGLNHLRVLEVQVQWGQVTSQLDHHFKQQGILMTSLIQEVGWHKLVEQYNLLALEINLLTQPNKDHSWEQQGLHYPLQEVQQVLE